MDTMPMPPLVDKAGNLTEPARTMLAWLLNVHIPDLKKRRVWRGLGDDDPRLVFYTLVIQAKTYTAEQVLSQFEDVAFGLWNWFSQFHKQDARQESFTVAPNAGAVVLLESTGETMQQKKPISRTPELTTRKGFALTEAGQQLQEWLHSRIRGPLPLPENGATRHYFTLVHVTGMMDDCDYFAQFGRSFAPLLWETYRENALAELQGRVAYLQQRIATLEE